MKNKLWSPVLVGTVVVAVLGLVNPGTAEQPPSPSGSSQPSATPPSVPAAARVRSLSVEKSADATTIRIHASGPLRYQAHMLSNPTRLVLDLPETILLARRRHIPVDTEPVVGVRTAQFKASPPVTRVVVDLLEEVAYEVKADSRGLRLTLRHAAAAKRAPASKTPVMIASLTPIVPATASAEPSAASGRGSPRPSEPPAEPKPEVKEASAQAPPPAPMPQAPGPQAPAPQAPGPQAPAEPTAAPTPPPTTNKYTGEPISVDLKDVDLKDFFRLIHEISGLNIILDPAVSGSVTLVLDEVPWDQALDIVLRNNKLDKVLEGNVLRIAALATLQSEEEAKRDVAKARDEAVELVKRTVVLSYAKATELEPTLTKFLSPRGQIITDARTNTMIIRDIPQGIPQLDDLIKQFDRKAPQVEIEARVVTASRSFARQLGAQLGLSGSPYFRPLSALGTAFGGVPAIGGSPWARTGSPIPTLNVGDAPPLVSSFPAAVDSESGFGFSIVVNERTFALDLLLSAAESRGVGKLLSKPRVITQNNVKAVIEQGTRIPVQTVVNNTISTQFIPVVLVLEVTPQITAEGTVFLDIDVKNDAINPGIARIGGIPALDTQHTNTRVLVSDGGTVVIGGVMTTETTYDIDQVPLLGSIPIIGHLFKRTTVGTRSQELLFFITPRILPG